VVGGGGGTIVVTLGGGGGGLIGPIHLPGPGGGGGVSPILPITPECFEGAPACAGGGAPPPPPPPEPGAEIVAGATVTLERELPVPQLTVQPGYAVTGLTAYLQIATGDNLPFTFAGFRNAVMMVCSWNHFDVKWGDGSEDPDVTSTGGPYPNGDVTHVYETASPGDDLGVTEYWSCPWHDELGAVGVVNLQTAGALPLEVRQIETVEN
jgi:hypothetical protein